MRFSFSEFTTAVLSLLFIVTGLWLTVKLKGLQFLSLGRALHRTLGSIFRHKGQGKGLSSLQASATALAGTLGTGNIAGVATAIAVGGPGTLFWMWISAFLGMILKYSEIVLAVHFTVCGKEGKSSGGPMRYIEKTLGSGPAVFFAGACIAASFGIGSLTQSSAASEAMHSAFGISEIIIGAFFALLTFLAAAGGMKHIGRITELLVPFMGILYLSGTLIVILPRLNLLPDVFRLIVSDAFSAKALTGGIFGVLTGKAVRIGISRGIFTNEAGMGSSSIAHSTADAASAGEEGLWGITEVFLDTIVMCTLTGTVILLSGAEGQGGASLTVAAFEHFLGRNAGGFIAVSSCLFAFASILVWCGYGEVALKYLGVHEKGIVRYRIIYSLTAAAGTVFHLETVFCVSDMLNLLMTVPNLTAIVLLSNTIRSETGNMLSRLYKN